MLITKTVKVRWHGNNRKHYEGLGYKFTKIGDEFEIKVKDLPKGSHIEVDCACDNCKKINTMGYDGYNKIVKENGETYCKTCSNKLQVRENMIKTKLRNGKSFYQWCIENNRKDVLDRWDYELNDCSPWEISYGSNKKCWFKCDKHSVHNSELKNIGSFTMGHKGSISCNQCNSIAQWFIDNNLDINDYWDFEKNTINPWDISYGNSSKKCWFKCTEKDYHGSYKMTCSGFTNGNRCPYCSSTSVHPKDSLGQYIINNYGEEFLYVWSDKNKKTPFEYAPNSKCKVWWKCQCGKHEDYFRVIKNTLIYEFRCPKCVEEMNNSIIEEKTKTYLEELGYDVLTEHECTIRPINPKTKHYLPYDNEIVLENGKHLIIEVHGGQHYKIINKNSNFTTKELTPEEYLHQRQLYDRYKRIYAKHVGYEYLEIPYTAFEGKNKEQYKQMIDDKINEILNIDKTS